MEDVRADHNEGQAADKIEMLKGRRMVHANTLGPSGLALNPGWISTAPVPARQHCYSLTASCINGVVAARSKILSLVGTRQHKRRLCSYSLAVARLLNGISRIAIRRR